MRAFCRFIGLLIVALGVPALAAAQTYPSKSIRLILAYPSGGAIDYVGRTLTQRLSETIGQPVVAENKPGAGGNIAADIVARAPADGYTLLLTDPGIATSPSLLSDLTYDVFKDLQTVSVVGSAPNVLIVPKKLPVDSIAALIAYGKANPGVLNYASPGIGTSTHLSGELFKLRTGIDATHIPYKGMATAMADIATGKVHMAFASIPAALPFITSGDVRALATTGAQRTAAFPDLPTVSESGLPGYAVELWTAIFAPAAVPRDLVARLSVEIKKALDHPDTKAAFAKVGTEPRGTTPEEGAAFVRAEYEKWRKVITDSNIK